jgi:hypothetical protein
MKWIYGFLAVLCFSNFECGEAKDEPNIIKCGGPCFNLATVKDLSGLDGCGFVLELADGTRLIPQRLVYVQPPDPSQDPGFYFNFVDGQKVFFDFRETEGVDACMAGKLVFLTCIHAFENLNRKRS